MASKKTTPKKSTKSKKLDLKDLDSGKDPKGGFSMNYGHLTTTSTVTNPLNEQGGTDGLMNPVKPPGK